MGESGAARARTAVLHGDRRASRARPDRRCLRRHDGGWTVVDWKTGRPPTAEQLPALSVQLAVYRLAWAALAGVAPAGVRAAFHYVAVGQTVAPADLLDERGLTALIATRTVHRGPVQHPSADSRPPGGGTECAGGHGTIRSMTTVLQYLVIAAVVAAVLFGIALLVFGRGSSCRRCRRGLAGRPAGAQHHRRRRAWRPVRDGRSGYRMSDVDWALERLADELDRTRARLAEVDPDGIDADTFVLDPDQQDLFADDEPIESTERDAMTDSDQAVHTDEASTVDDHPGAELPGAEPAADLRADPARAETDGR